MNSNALIAMILLTVASGQCAIVNVSLKDFLLGPVTNRECSFTPKHGWENLVTRSDTNGKVSVEINPGEYRMDIGYEITRRYFLYVPSNGVFSATDLIKTDFGDYVEGTDLVQYESVKPVESKPRTNLLIGAAIGMTMFVAGGIFGWCMCLRRKDGHKHRGRGLPRY